MSRENAEIDGKTCGKAIAVAMLCLGFLPGQAVAQGGGRIEVLPALGAQDV